MMDSPAGAELLETADRVVRLNEERIVADTRRDAKPVVDNSG